MRAVLALLLPLALLAAVAPPGRGEESPWIGLDGVDPFAEGAVDGATLAPLGRPGRLLVRTTPIPWGRLVPVGPVAGRQLHDWEALDRFVAAWEAAGHEVVLVVSPEAAWLGTAQGPSAWEARVAAEVPATQRSLLLEGAGSGARVLPPDRWDDWQDFARDLVERYDADGVDDADGLLRPVRWLQVLDRPARPGTWQAGPEDYVRLLHHARLGARLASRSVQVAHGGVRLPLFEGDAPRTTRQLLRAWEREHGREPPARRVPAQWELEFAARTLGLTDVFEAVVLEGAPNLQDEDDALRLLVRLLAAEGRPAIEPWLAATPAAKLADSSIDRATGIAPAEARIRARWRATLGLADHADRERARAWYERGVAFDLVRTVVLARVAGARRVFLGDRDHLLAARDDVPEGLATFLRRTEDGTCQATPALHALVQAEDRLGPATAARAVEASGGARAVRFDRAAGRGAPWVVVVVPDPDLDWAGDPREDPVRRDVALRLDPGAYQVEPVRLGAEPAAATVVGAPDGILRLEVGPSPLYVLPARP